MLKATGKRYIIEAEEQNKTTSSGIILKHSNETQFAIINNAGAGVDEPLPANTKVVVEWSRAVPVKDPDTSKQYFIIESHSVIAVVEEL